MLAAWAEANSIATEATRHIRTVKSFSTESMEIGLYTNVRRSILLRTILG